jgi:PPOX class probable F420-dependent enzyme
VLLPIEVEAFINSQRLARLATVDEQGRPHIVPICFAHDDGRIYSVLDSKPKRVPVRELRRVRNLLANPNVQLLFDRYDEDWTRLAYVQLHGVARLIEAGDEQHYAVQLLRQRYAQYEAMDLEAAPVIAIEIKNTVTWGAV